MSIDPVKLGPQNQVFDSQEIYSFYKKSTFNFTQTYVSSLDRMNTLKVVKLTLKITYIHLYVSIISKYMECKTSSFEYIQEKGVLK